MKRKVAVFDFDGTLTTKDTLLEFIKFACGRKKFFIGFLLFSPLLILMKFHLYPNWKAKQQVFTWFFKGLSYEDFVSMGKSFAKKIDFIRKKNICEKLINFKSQGYCVYVVSASVDEWVRPFCESQLSVDGVLATHVEVDKNGILTGKFSSRNCYGQEKVNRLLCVEPNRNEYCLYAFGDSAGDKEMLQFADHGVLVK